MQNIIASSAPTNFRQNLKLGTNLWKADREIVSDVDFHVIKAIAEGNEAASDYEIFATMTSLTIKCSKIP